MSGGICFMSFLLHCALSLAAQYIVIAIGPVCVCVGLLPR